MNPIETTPQAAAALYATMAEKLALARRRTNKRPLTLTEKVLLAHLDDPLAPEEEYLSLRPDRVVLQDVLGQTAFLQFMQTGRARVAIPTTVHCDHLIQARAEARSDLLASLQENNEVYDFLQSAAAKYGAGFWKPGAGIIHQVVLENYAYPGQLILGTDSHTPTAGGLGACAIGVGGADAVEAMAGRPFELPRPRRIGVWLKGQLSGWTAPKDVIAWLAGQLTVSGGTRAIIEYLGPGARTLSATGKATIANMGAELGATTSLFPADARMQRYLEATGRGALNPVIDQYRALFEADAEVEREPSAYFERVLELDLSALEPQIVGPHSPDLTRPISEPGAVEVDTISAVLVGSCTNSSYEDLSRAADVAAQATARGLASKTPLLITPGSARVRATIERDGQLARLEAIGGVVLANACGPCIGQWRRASDRAPDRAGEPNSIVTTYNRNFPGRNDGSRATKSYIASPELAIALAIAGRLSFNPLRDTLIDREGNAFLLEAPQPAPEVPKLGFVVDRSLYVAPPADGASIAVVIDPASERLAQLPPWPAWDGADFVELPILFKAKGKTTTDQISPAGPWLRFRGHLEKFSDNFLSGAVDAFTGASGLPVASRARALRSAGVKWVVIGDFNYGEGSSREHAALSPRLLGGAAIIARSFARIHETNLKKQGLLALSFVDPADYERIDREDRISLCELDGLRPRVPVMCEVRKRDGSTRMIPLAHSYSASQLEWFRRGSALRGLSS